MSDFHIEEAVITNIGDGFIELTYGSDEHLHTMVLQVYNIPSKYFLSYVEISASSQIVISEDMHVSNNVRVIFSSNINGVKAGDILPFLVITKINSKIPLTEGNKPMFTKNAKQKIDDFVGTPAYLEVLKEIKRKFIEYYDLRLKSLEFLVNHFDMKDPKDTVESCLIEAKMIYDYLAGESKHFDAKITDPLSFPTTPHPSNYSFGVCNTCLKCGGELKLESVLHAVQVMYKYRCIQCGLVGVKHQW